MGNNRIVAQMGGTVVQKNHYYPFGMAFAENAGTSPNRTSIMEKNWMERMG
ncbi:MAG: hypothetical protein LBS20_12715 [Prevotella sp.]|nr:hypothetical protein [Prevotella sp.]